MAYWLFKSEPDCFSFADLMAAPERSTGWDGVRNYQARNFLRDQVRRGDLVLFYHSNANPPGIAGIAEVVREAHPDPTAFDPQADHYDPKSDPDNPIWFQVSIRAVRPVEPPLTLPQLRAEPRLDGLELLRKGSRLSVMPVSADHWAVIEEMIGLTAPQPKSKTRRKPA
ncbi:EVE domain-containing protein [Tautonia sociabilis]|uniref:EVE domain-containing protein n=1 Tax=Tautonia sociabilis TaxID=2080755 RepID=A0A432MKB1_9BACT|nr:EVE domain-containing protein [Tautonia sociabilis]RUL87615.1 EVE domain-containing protein [Tautonia sociabilis]